AYRGYGQEAHQDLLWSHENHARQLAATAFDHRLSRSSIGRWYCSAHPGQAIASDGPPTPSANGGGALLLKSFRQRSNIEHLDQNPRVSATRQRSLERD